MINKIDAVANEAEVKNFIRHHWSAKQGLTRDKELYKAIKKKTDSKNSAVTLAKELNDSATRYAAILSPSHSYWNSKGDEVKSCLGTFQLFNISQNRPLLLAITEKFADGDLKSSFSALQAVAVRNKMMGRTGSGSTEKVYSELAKKISDVEIDSYAGLKTSISKVMPTDSEFKEGFAQAKVSSPKISRYLLRILERVKTGEQFPEFVPNPNALEVDLEHILPKKHSENWDAFGGEDVRQDHVNRLGNHALLSVPLNSAADRGTFTSKLTPFFSV